MRKHNNGILNVDEVMHMLNERELKIINFLENKKDYVSGEELAAFLGISSKTLRNDIKMINQSFQQCGASISATKGKGYFLCINDGVQFANYIDKECEENIKVEMYIPTTHVGRVEYIIKKLLLKELHKIDSLTQTDLSEELFIGLTTLKSDLVDVKEQLHHFHIEVIKDGSKGISIKGEEANIRSCIRYYIFHEGNTIIDLHEIAQIFKKEYVIEVNAIVKESLSFHHLAITDVSYYNLLVHILIGLERIESNNTVFVEQYSEALFNSIEYKAAQSIVEKVNKSLKIRLTLEETYYIALHLLTRKTFIHAQSEQTVANDEFETMVDETLNYLQTSINLAFQEDIILRNSLTVHLKSAINRIRFDMHINNNLLGDIKRNYGFSFKIASLAATFLNEKYALNINEDEIGYICLHIEAALQRSKDTKVRGKIKALIVCASGLGTAMMISAKVKSEFGNMVDIVGVISLNELKEIQKDTFDLVISTISIDKQVYGLMDKTTIQIPIILKKNDLDHIANVLHEKQGNTLIDFLEYTEEDLFFAKTNFTTRDEILDFMLSKLVKKQYLKESDKKFFYKRENISSTEIGNMVAIPHAIDIDPCISKIAILINKRPIVWEHEKVRLVILLSIRKELYVNFESIFEKLYNVLSEEENVFALLNVKNYREFIKVVR